MDRQEDHDAPEHEYREEEEAVVVEEEVKRPRELPADLPRSLDDRQNFHGYTAQETEYYDAWQGIHEQLET